MSDYRDPSKRPGGSRPGQKPNLGGKPTKPLKAMVFWVILVLVLLIAFQMFEMGKTPEYRISYSEFLTQIDEGNIKRITFKGLEVHGSLANPTLIPVPASGQSEGIREIKVESFTLVLPAEDKDLPQRIIEKNSNAVVEGEVPGGSLWVKLLTSGLPLLLIVGLWLLIMRQMQVGGNRAFSFGKSRARMFGGDRPRVTFQDVAGADEAKEELEEIIEFLRDPKKFQKLGGRIPKGAILLGPPGTGKTLLARAVAGEANVPFFSMSGSDFVEMFVGVGASRVRDLFDQGKKHAPCILFIDEIDAVGRHRGAGLGGGHDEREQTLNQLLVEMDGFESNEGVILIAATNRPDVLDPALLRPGRFDRRVIVPRPDVKGREGILKVHMRRVPVAPDVDISLLSRQTPGFAGADLENLVNEAALLAARKNKDRVEMNDFELAKDKVMMGSERRSMVLSLEERRNTAYHEAGHALVAKLIPGTDPVHKVTIIPRGMALGLTQQVPIDDRHTYTRDFLTNNLAILFGGRVAEELCLKQVTTGAGNDLERATELARKMVCEWGMSERLGPMTFGKKEEQIFLGRDFTQLQDYSQGTAQEIDREVRRLIEEAYERAKRLLTAGLPILHRMAEELLERESLDGADIDQIMKQFGPSADGQTSEPVAAAAS